MRGKKRKPPRPIIEPQRWAEESAFPTLHHFNERGLLLLAAQAMEGESLAALWRQMDARAFRRAACYPVLLMELHFQRLDKWQLITQRRMEPGLPRANSSPADERTTMLLREVLLEAWTLGRTMPRTLSLLFGMASPVAANIAQLSALDIDRIAVEQARYLKQRWPESRNFWRGLLEAAIGTDDRALHYVHLHCIQLLGSDVVVL